MQNSEYWAKRFEILQEKQFQNAEKYLKELEIQYKKSYISLEEKICKWYTRLAVNNQVSLDDAKKLLSNNELEEFRWTLEEYIEKGKANGLSEDWTKQLENASARVHINKLQAMQIQIQAEIEQLYQKQSIDVTDLEDEIYTDTYYKSAYEIQKGNSIAWQIPALPKELINELISKPWTTDNLTFSDRIWKNKNELNYALQTQLTQAIIKGDSLDNLIKSISKQFNVSKNKAGRLVMTESAFFSSAAQKKCFENLSVQQYEIVATLDSHTSNICQELDGKVFDMKDYSVGITAPPFHVYCRSVTAPYFEDNYTERIARNENGKTYYVPGDMNYKEWEAKYVTNSDNSGIIQEQTKKIIKSAKTFKVQPKYKKISEDEYFKLQEKHRNNITEDIRSSIYVTNWDNMQTLNKYGYINSNYSRHINYIKRTGYTEAFTPKEIKEFNKTTSNLEIAIKNNKIDKNIQATRYLDIEWFEDKLDKQTYKEIKRMKKFEKLKELKGKEVLDNQFISGSLQEEFNVYSDRKVRMIIQADKGTNAFITENKMEREIIFNSSKLLIKEISINDNNVIEIIVKILKGG